MYFDTIIVINVQKNKEKKEKIKELPPYPVYSSFQYDTPLSVHLKE